MSTVIIDLPPEREPESDEFFCYQYLGPRALDSGARRDPLRETPPFLLKEWLGKPKSMRAKTVFTRDDALAWLRKEMDALREQVIQQLGMATIMSEERWQVRLDRFDFKRRELGHDQILVEVLWLTGARMADLTIIPNKSPTLAL